MHLNTAIKVEKDFAKWQLDVGKGMYIDNDSNILLPNLFHCRENTVASLIETIYSRITRPNLSHQQKEHSLLCLIGFLPCRCLIASIVSTFKMIKGIYFCKTYQN